MFLPDGTVLQINGTVMVGRSACNALFEFGYEYPVVSAFSNESRCTAVLVSRKGVRQVFQGVRLYNGKTPVV